MFVSLQERKAIVQRKMRYGDYDPSIYSSMGRVEGVGAREEMEYRKRADNV
jgi:hypothetical protein